MSASGADDELNSVISEAEAALRALNLVKDPLVRRQQASKARSLLVRAEQLKQHGRLTPQAVSHETSEDPQRQLSAFRGPTNTRVLPKSEQILVLKSSWVNGLKFVPWESQPVPSSFDFNIGQKDSLFEDATDFVLSRKQRESLAGWYRPVDALPPPTRQSTGGPRVPVSMHIGADVDLVQDAATDCSVVASLCTALARVQRGHSPLLPSMFFPYNVSTSSVMMSESGRYVGRFHFNGTDRRVEIDDRLPVSKTDRIIHCIDRNNPGLLWPALIEKMYLKVRGGYDFPGSNSSTDIWVIFGWIPEQVFLHSDAVSMLDLWSRIWTAHRQGDVMITLGTGKLSPRSERAIGLASEHDYAILDLREEQGQKLMLVKNPWCEGQTWNGTRSQSSGQLEEKVSILSGHTAASPRDLLNAKSELSPGTFWMDIHSVEQNFDAVYLNWNPALFKYRRDVHFVLDTGAARSSSSLHLCPQFRVSVMEGESAWLVLSRHFSDDRSIARSKQASTAGFISLTVYDADGIRVIPRDNPMHGSPFVDSHNVMLQLCDLRSGKPYTVVVEQEMLPDPSHTFTLSAFSEASVILEPAVARYRHNTTVTGNWDETTAGGNSSSPLFSCNPQFAVTLHERSTLSVLLDTTDRSLAVNVKVLFGRGQRMYRVRARDVLGDSDKYRPGFGVAYLPVTEPGTYTVVCSTYEAGKTGSFALYVGSNAAVSLRKIPQDAATRLRSPASEVFFPPGQRAMALLLLPQRLTRFTTVIVPEQNDDVQPSASRSMMRASVIQGNDYEHKTIADSCAGEFEEIGGGIRTTEIDLSPSMCTTSDLFLIVEKDSAVQGQDDEIFSVCFLTDSKDAVQSGDWRAWNT